MVSGPASATTVNVVSVSGPASATTVNVVSVSGPASATTVNVVSVSGPASAKNKVNIVLNVHINHKANAVDDDELMLNVLRCQMTY